MSFLQELNSYKGDANLAAGTAGNGGVLGAGELKWDAVDRFSQLSYQTGRDKWVQKNLDMQQAAKAAADAINVQLGDMIAPDREAVNGKLEEYFRFYKDHPDAVRLKTNPDGTTNAEQVAQMGQLHTELLFSIGRANQRALQYKVLQDDKAKVQDPRKQQQYGEWETQMLATPLGDNIVLMPQLNVYDASKAINDAASLASRKYGRTKVGLNDNFDREVTVVDPDVASSQLLTMYYNPQTPDAQDFKSFVDDSRENFNAIVNAKDAAGNFKYKDAQGNLDLSKLKGDSAGRTLLELVDGYNDYLHTLNDYDVSDQAGKSKMKVHQFIGKPKYESTIDLSKTSEIGADDFIKMSLVHKLQLQSDEKVSHTGSGDQRRGQDLDYKAAAERNKLQWNMFEAGKGKPDDPESLGEAKARLYVDVIGSDENGQGSNNVAFKDDQGKQRSGTSVSITPQLQEALTVPLDQEKKTVSKTRTGNQYSNNQTESETTTTSKVKAPTGVYVQPNKANRDASLVFVTYDDGSTVRMNGNGFFNQLDGLYGKAGKTKLEVSEGARKFNDKLKLTGPKYKSYLDYMRQPTTPAVKLNGSYIYNGKSFSLEMLRQKYSDEQIQQLIDKKILQ